MNHLQSFKESRLIAWFCNLVLIGVAIVINGGIIQIEGVIYQEIYQDMAPEEKPSRCLLGVALLIVNLWFGSKLIQMHRFFDAPWDRMKEISLSLPGFIGITKKSGRLVIESCSTDLPKLLETETNLLGSQVMHTLFSKEHVRLGAMTRERLEKTLQTVIGETEASFNTKKHNLPEQLIIPRLGNDDRILELSYETNQRKPFQNEKKIRGIIIGLKDITEKIRMENQALRQQAILEKQREANTRQRLAMQGMLRNVHQGIFTINAEQRIEPNYSNHLTTLLGTDSLEGQKALDLLFNDSNLNTDQIDQIQTVLKILNGGDTIAFALNRHVLIKQFEKKQVNGAVSTYTIEWIPIYNDDTRIEKMMVTLQDITQTLALKAEVAKQKRESEIALEIISVSQDQFYHFLSDSFDLIERSRSVLEQHPQKDLKIIAELFRDMHTLKGNARTYNFTHLAPVVHDAEQKYVQIRNSEQALWDQKRLLADIDAIRHLLREYEDIGKTKLGRNRRNEDSREDYYRISINKVQRLLENLDKNGESAIRETQHELSMLGTDRLEDVLSSIIHSLPQLAKELNKQTPQVIIEDHGVNIHASIATMLKNVFMHTFRNTLDHGFAEGQKGKLHLIVSVDQDRLMLSYSDNGRGLNLPAIRQKAMEQFTMLTIEALSDQEIANLIFLSGLSTATEVTDISGRGVGMDAIKKMVEHYEGTIELQLVDSHYRDSAYIPFKMIIKLPKQYGIFRKLQTNPPQSG